MINLLKSQYSLPAESTAIERYHLDQTVDACFVVQAFRTDRQLSRKAIVYFEFQNLRFKIYDFEMLGLRFFVTHEVLEKMYRVSGNGTYTINYSIPTDEVSSSLGALDLGSVEHTGERNRYQGSHWDASAPGGSDESSDGYEPSTKSGLRLKGPFTTPSSPMQKGAQILEFWEKATEGFDRTHLPASLQFLATVDNEALYDMEYELFSSSERDVSFGHAPSDMAAIILLHSGRFFDLGLTDKCEKWLTATDSLVTGSPLAMWMKSQNVPKVVMHLTGLVAGEQQLEFFRTYCAIYLAFSARFYGRYGGNHSSSLLRDIIAQGSRNTITISRTSFRSNAHMETCMTFLFYARGISERRRTKGFKA